MLLSDQFDMNEWPQTRNKNFALLLWNSTNTLTFHIPVMEEHFTSTSTTVTTTIEWDHTSNVDSTTKCLSFSKCTWADNNSRYDLKHQLYKYMYFINNTDLNERDDGILSEFIYIYTQKVNNLLCVNCLMCQNHKTDSLKFGSFVSNDDDRLENSCLEDKL